MNFGIPDNICNTGLGLGLGCWEKQENLVHPDQEKKKINRRKPFLRDDDQLAPLLTLGLPKQSFPFQFPITKVDPDLQPRASSPRAVSSFSNSSSVKKEKDLVDGGKGGEVELEEERVSSKASDEDEEGSPRKKLRLTKEQSAVLEDRFKEQSTLSPKQKHALAEQLNLRPRQVEVWFQNRRARTKLKQTELDCELLKRCCETLSEENKRLHKEIQELKSLKHAAPLYMRFPAATLTMCPSCERIEGGIGADGTSTVGPFTVGSKSHFYNSFTHPSAAW